MRSPVFLRLLCAVSLPLFVSLVAGAEINAAHMALERRYSTAHSLGDNYQFDARDGWQTVNMSNLLYKYSRSLQPPDGFGDTSGSPSLAENDVSGNETASGGPRRLMSRANKGSAKGKSDPAKTILHMTGSKKTSSPPKSKSAKTTTKSGSLTGALNKVVGSIKGIGKAEPVTITWYTGQDLLNPSCWANTDWAPTDASFVAALTLDGWQTKPKCFKFLELCNSPQKCAFVRVVDSCAGCEKGSKHVDLTRAAFSTLANLDEGILTVHMRQATDPADGWLDNLWGPKH